MKTKNGNSSEIPRKNGRKTVENQWKNNGNSVEIPCKNKILTQIAADPEQALRDIEVLKKQLIVERMLTEQKEKLCCLFNQQAIEFWEKYHFCRTRLIRARILVKELKRTG